MKTRIETWRWMLSLALLSSWSAAAAPAVPAEADTAKETVIVDNAFEDLWPAILRRPFQRIPDDGERPYWSDPRADAPRLRFEAPRMLSAEDVLWIDPVSYNEVSMARRARVAAISTLATPERMQAAIRDAFAQVDEVAGGRGSRVVFAREAGKAQVARALADRDSGQAMTLQRPVIGSHLPDPGAVQLSWDDRQVLITLRIQRFRKVRGKHLSIRDLGPSTTYHYVGAPLPEGVDPIAYWTRDDGEPLLSALRDGFAHIVRTARSTSDADAATAPSPTAMVMVGDRLQRFPGTVIERGEGVARLKLGKAEYLLVATGTAR